MNTKERIENFKEDCKSVVSKFRTTLFYYDSEKNGDFRAFAINESAAKNKILFALHNGVLAMLDETDFKSVWELLDILNTAFDRIDEDMNHTTSYIDFVNYLESKEN